MYIQSDSYILPVVTSDKENVGIKYARNTRQQKKKKK